MLFFVGTPISCQYPRSAAFVFCFLFDSGSCEMMPHVFDPGLIFPRISVASQRDGIRNVIETLTADQGLTASLKKHGPYIDLDILSGMSAGRSSFSCSLLVSDLFVNEVSCSAQLASLIERRHLSFLARR